MSSANAPSPPELKTLSIDVDSEIGTLTLNRPDALNAMSPELIFELDRGAEHSQRISDLLESLQDGRDESS